MGKMRMFWNDLIPAAAVLLIFQWGCGDSAEKPGAVEELFYDEGTMRAEYSPWTGELGGRLGVVFTPTFYPARLVKARFFVGFFGIPETEFKVRVFRATLAGGPEESDLLASEMLAAAAKGYQWVDVDLSERDIVIHEGDFCVAMEWLTPPGEEGGKAQFLGISYAEPDRRSWWKTDRDSNWQRIEDVSGNRDGDLMIRAVVSNVKTVE